MATCEGSRMRRSAEECSGVEASLESGGGEVSRVKREAEAVGDWDGVLSRDGVVMCVWSEGGAG